MRSPSSVPACSPSARSPATSASGGAATPEEAGRGAARRRSRTRTCSGVVDLLLPGERETLRDPLTDLVDELQRLEVLSEDASLSGIAGVDLAVEDGDGRGRADQRRRHRQPVRSRAADHRLDRRRGAARSATGSATTSTRTSSELDTESGPTEEDTLPMTAVREDGRWYLSLFYTAAEAIRAETGEDIPSEGVAPAGGDAPEAAIDAVLDGIEHLDLEAVIAALNPDEFQALQRYAPLFLEEAQAELDEPSRTSRSTSPTGRTTCRAAGDTPLGDRRRADDRRHRRGRVGDDRAARTGAGRRRRRRDRRTRARSPTTMPALDEVVDDPAAGRGAAWSRCRRRSPTTRTPA